MEWTAEKLKELCEIYHKTSTYIVSHDKNSYFKGVEKYYIALFDMCDELALPGKPMHQLYCNLSNLDEMLLTTREGYETLKEDLKDPDFWDMIVKLPPQVIYKRYQITPPKEGN